MTNISFSLNVRYEVVNPQLAKAYVNETYVGRVKCADDRVTFRHHNNPSKNTVPKFENFYARPMNEIIADCRLLEQLTPIVIRNYLHNFGFLHSAIADPTDIPRGMPDETSADCEALIETMRIAA